MAALISYLTSSTIIVLEFHAMRFQALRAPRYPGSAGHASVETFADAANEAGMSRRYGGIHFARADLAGRHLGRLVADKAWSKALSLFDGTAQPNRKEELSMSIETQSH